MKNKILLNQQFWTCNEHMYFTAQKYFYGIDLSIAFVIKSSVN